MFLQCDREAVDFIVFLHVQEWIIIELAEKANGGLDSPVIAIRLKQFVFEKEAAVEAAHISIRDAPAINYTLIHHFLSTLTCPRLIYPIRLDPMFLWDEPKRYGGSRQNTDSSFKFFREGFIIQENPWIIVLFIEAILH